MEFTAQQIAQYINGRIEGDENVSVHNFSKIEEGKTGTISFLSNPKYTQYLYNTQSSIVLIDDKITIDRPVTTTLIWVQNAYDAIAKIGKNVYIGAFVSMGGGVVVGDNTQIYPHVVLCDNVSVGDDCLFYPQVTVYHDCKIGNHVILHAGCVIGADGFGFAPTSDGYDKIPQIGIVTIEDHVEIGANTCVDRSTMGSTYIRKGVKLDNLVQIAHNTEIGEHTVMSAQVGVAGSTKIGQWCMFGGQVGIAGHITIGDKVYLGAQSGVPGSLKDNQQLMGTPPMEQIRFFRSHAVARKLPEMYKQLNELQREIELLKKTTDKLVSNNQE